MSVKGKDSGLKWHDIHPPGRHKTVSALEIHTCRTRHERVEGAERKAITHTSLR